MSSLSLELLIPRRAAATCGGSGIRLRVLVVGPDTSASCTAIFPSSGIGILAVAVAVGLDFAALGTFLGGNLILTALTFFPTSFPLAAMRREPEGTDGPFPVHLTFDNWSGICGCSIKAKTDDVGS